MNTPQGTPEEKNELILAFESYEWIILHTNPLHNEIDLSFPIEPVPSYIREDVGLHKQKEWLLDKNKTPRDILFGQSINSLLSELVKKGIPLYKVDKKEITCVADIKRLWQETELDKNYYSFITTLSYTYKVIQARLTSQRLKIEKELMLKLEPEEQDTPASTPQKVIPFPTPSGTQWHEVEISFIDSENVKISARDKTATKHFFDMGFRKGKTCKPVKSWNTLFTFSEKRCLTYSQSIKSKTEKYIQDLRKRLKAYFGIQDDPIILDHGYKPVFKVCSSESKSRSRSVHAFSNSKVFDKKEDD